MVLIIKKLFSAVLAAALLLSFCPEARAESAPEISAGSALVMHSGGEVIYERNGDERVLIASTTKLMTAILVLESCALEDVVEIKSEYCGIEGSSMYLEPGQKCTVRELLLGLLLVSGNDAAMALACHVSGSAERFAALMNQKARELGMTNSHFVNPHGLNADGHYSTARDMARLMAYCMENQDFARLCAVKTTEVAGQTLINHNKLLSLCPGCIGGKTGYTESAGRCLVSCCERNGMRLICVTFGAPDDWNDHQKLYDWAYANYCERLVTEGIGFEIPVISGNSASVRAVPEELRLFLPKTAVLSMEAELPYFVFAPIQEGETAGKAIVSLDGREIAETRLYYEQSVEPAVRAGDWND